MKIDPIDARMLELADTLVGNDKVPSYAAYFASIGFARQNIHNIRRGHQTFQREHIHMACEVSGANANWIYGLESNMFRKVRPVRTANLKTNYAGQRVHKVKTASKSALKVREKR